MGIFNVKKAVGVLAFLTSLCMGSTYAQLRTAVGSINFSDWSGYQKVKQKEAYIAMGDTLLYTYSNQNRIYFPKISRNYFGDSADWTKYKGLEFELYSASPTTTEITAQIKVDSLDYTHLNPVSKAKISIAGKGWHSVYIPWDLFEIDAGQMWGTLFAVKHLELFVNKTSAPVQIRNVFVTAGPTISIKTAIQGKAGDAGTAVNYEIEVGNTTTEPQGIQLRLATEGWESMKTSITPQSFNLGPGEIKTCQVSVTIPEKLPVGIREKQVIKAVANGQGASAASLELTTAVHVPFPNIMFSSEGWQEIRDKVTTYDWAKEGLKDYERRAKRWEVSDGANIIPADGAENLGKPVLSERDSKNVLNCAIAYQLTQNEEYAAKCIKFIRRLVRPEDGYPATLVGGSNQFVGEGKFWQAVGKSYDLVRNSPQFTNKDHELVAKTFRLFAERTIQGNSRGAISNWNVAEITAALYCALNLQDWHLIDQLLNGSTGIYKHLEHGIMSDGWWYECAVGYNTWVASEFSEIAIALQPWGINFKDMKFPLGTTAHFSLLNSRRKGGVYGMQFEKWGAIERNDISIKDMWDASIPFVDFRGVLPAINDALEGKLAGRPYELAYYLYRDPEYAAIINRSDSRDLLYGVPDLPEVTSEQMKVSAYADNMGIVQLRSQKENREQREQIQATLHYGSHGGYHGHFDRTNLVSMMRYGRSFYGTLMYWYGYGSYLYKFLKQTSINKNMVVVDEKMQEPVKNSRTLFYTGKMMQATAVETNSRWSYPPYGGIASSKRSFPDKAWSEGRSILFPENAPDFGAVTEYTEPILQRRLMVMMDDYIVLADYLEGEKEHQFDWMFQAKGFKGMTAAGKSFIKHSNQMNTDPLGSAQFVTDCNWFKTEGTSRAQFEMCWGDGCDNEGVRLPHSLDGPLKIDVFNAWPKQNEIMIGTAPESFKVNKKVWYTLSAENKELLKDSTGAWILGSKKIDLDIRGKKDLEITIKTENKVNNNTLFLGNAKVLLADGSEVLLNTLPVTYDNILMPAQPGKDYYNGPVKIAGQEMYNTTPAMPKNTAQIGKIKVDLSGVEALRFQTILGGDFPLGDETSRLKTMAVRNRAQKMRYLSVIEPYENSSMIQSVTAKSANKLVVELTDGRVQEITISALENNSEQPKVEVKELRNGKEVRSESTTN